MDSLSFAATRRLTTSKTGVPNVISLSTVPFGSQIDARRADSSLEHVSETSRHLFRTNSFIFLGGNTAALKSSGIVGHVVRAASFRR